MTQLCQLTSVDILHVHQITRTTVRQPWKPIADSARTHMRKGCFLPYSYTYWVSSPYVGACPYSRLFWGLLLYKLCIKSCGIFFHLNDSLAKVNKFHQWITEQQEAREAAHTVCDPILTSYKRNWGDCKLRKQPKPSAKQEGAETDIDTKSYEKWCNRKIRWSLMCPLCNLCFFVKRNECLK